MSKKRDSLLYKKDIDSLDKALEYIEKLKNRIVKIQKKNKELDSENKTLKKVWDKTELFLEDEIAATKPLIDLINTSKNNGKFTFEADNCPKCDKKRISKLIFNKFHIEICDSCDYRKRIDGFSSSKN